MARWQLTDAQKHLPEVAEKAYSDGPQTIVLARGRSVTVSRSKPKRPKSLTLREIFSGVPLAQIIPPRSKEKVGPSPFLE